MVRERTSGKQHFTTTALPVVFPRQDLYSIVFFYSCYRLINDLTASKLHQIPLCGDESPRIDVTRCSNLVYSSHALRKLKIRELFS